MLKKRRLILICSLIGGMGVIIPSATTAGILISNNLDQNSSNNQLANVDGDDDNVSVPLQGTKPQFLNKIKLNELSEKPLDQVVTTLDPKTTSQVKNYQKSLSEIASKTNLSVSANTIKDYVNNLLESMISPPGQAASFEYLESDVNSFLLNIFNQNSQSFSLLTDNSAKTNSDGSPKVGSEGIVPNLNSVIINGSFKFKNITDSPQTLKDVNGNPIENSDGSTLKPIPAGSEISFKFNTVNDKNKPSGSKINGIVSTSSEDSNKAFLNWDVDRIQFQIGTRNDYSMPDYLATLPESMYNPSLKIYKNFVFSKDKSALNVCLDNVSAGINPYDAINNLVGPNKMFNPTTLTGQMVGNDLKNLFKDNFNLSKSIAILVNGLFGSIYNHHNNGNYTMAQVIVDNAQRIANLITINNPSDNESINGGPSVNKLIFDLLSSYSKNANAKTIFQILYDDKDALIDYIVQNIPQFGDLKDVILSLFDGVASPDDLFSKLKSLIEQFKSILQTPQFKSLFPIIEKVINNKDIYLLDLVSDKEVAQTIFDLVLNLANVPKDSNNPTPDKTQPNINDPSKFTLSNFLNKYESLFVNLITSSKDPVGEFISGLLQAKTDPKTNKTTTGLEDILSLVGFSASDFSPQIQKIFDMFFTNNDSLKNTKENINNIYNLFGQISNLFSDSNMKNITMKPINESAFNKIKTTYSSKDSSFVVDLPKEGVGYTISVNGTGWSIPNSFIKTLVNLAPKNKLLDFINLFLDDKTKALVKEKALHSIPSAASWIPGVSNAVTNAVNNTINGVLGSIKQGTTIKDLVNEIMFGYDKYNPSDSWMSITGNINVSYSGENLYILPSYKVNGSGKTITNYQIISANLLIDPTDIASKSIFKGYSKSKDLSPSKVPADKQTISKFNLSAQLYKSFNALVNNFIQYTAGRTYDIKSNIYLFPTKKNKNNRTVPYFELNPYNPNQNVAPNTFDSNLYIKSNNKRLGSKNINQTKDYLLGSKDSWQGYDSKTKKPIISNAGINIIKDFYDYQNSKLNSFSKYITISQNFYGTGPGNINISLNKVVVQFIFGLKFNINLSINYEIRMMDSTIVLPYKVIDLSNKDNPKFIDSIRNDLTYFIISEPNTSVKFDSL